MTLWMEVDLKNKELPTGRMATKSRELSRMLGLHPCSVSAAICQAAKNGGKCRYVRVDLDDKDDTRMEINMSDDFYADPLRDRPCWECPKNKVCQGTCEKWESWFRRAWREIQAQFQMIRLKENMR